MIVVGDHVGEWVAQQIGNTKFHNFQAIGIEKDGKLIAGAVIDQYAENARCSLHCAGIGKRWLTREFLFVVFDYIFRQLNVNVVINTVDSNNTDSIRFTKHIGYKEVARIAGGWGDSDLLIFALHRNECRWINAVRREEIK